MPSPTDRFGVFVGAAVSDEASHAFGPFSEAKARDLNDALYAIGIPSRIIRLRAWPEASGGRMVRPPKKTYRWDQATDKATTDS